MTDTHVTIDPAILCFGTPVVLISTQNEDGTANLAPMSSAWWLGWRCMLGLQTASKTPQNMIRSACSICHRHGTLHVRWTEGFVLCFI